MRHGSKQTVSRDEDRSTKASFGNIAPIMEERMHREDVDVITRLMSRSSALLVGEADSISAKAVEEVISASHIAAALPWSDLTPEALESAPAQVARLPSALRVGSLKDEALGSILTGGNGQETPRLESRCRATEAMAAEIFHECGSRIKAGANAAALFRGLKRQCRWANRRQETKVLTVTG